MLFLCAALPLSGIESSVRTDYLPESGTSRRNILLTISAESFPEQEIARSLDRGQRVRVTYDMRIYRKRTGVFAFLGDLLEQTSTVIFEAWKDPILGVYTVSSDFSGGPVSAAFGSRREVMEFLRTLDRYPVAPKAPSFGSSIKPERESAGTPDRVIILARIRVLTEILIPPFNILSPLLSDLRKTSNWTRVEVPAEGSPR